MHDKEDVDVSVKRAYHIHEHLQGSELVITEGLGHRKILGDEAVINKIKNSFQNKKVLRFEGLLLF